MEAKLRSRGLGQVIDAIPEEPYLVPFTTQEEFVLEARLPDCDTFFSFFFSKFARRSFASFFNQASWAVRLCTALPHTCPRCHVRQENGRGECP
jgi:hypothetical protein